MPKGTVVIVLKLENKAIILSILTYHVVPGRISSKDLATWIRKGRGKDLAKTVQGEKLTFWMKGKDIYVSDVKGNKAKVTIANVNQSNGVIHVIDTLLTP